MANGDTKRGAGITINLLRQPDTVAARISSACARFASLAQPHRVREKAASDTSYAAIVLHYNSERYKRFQAIEEAERDSVELLRKLAHTEVLRALVGQIADTTSAGMNAHYRFAAVPSGAYALFASWTIGQNEYAWLAPISVVSGQNSRRDLDNTVERGAAMRCAQ